MQEPIVLLQHQQAVGGSMALRVSTPVARALGVKDVLLLLPLFVRRLVSVLIDPL